MTALLHIIALSLKLPILLHKQAKWRFIVKVAVYNEKSVTNNYNIHRIQRRRVLHSSSKNRAKSITMDFEGSLCEQDITTAWTSLNQIQQKL